MEEDKLLKIGFNPNVDRKGNKIFYHPEGITYEMINGDFRLITTSSYPYLWVSYKGSFNKLVSRRISEIVIKKAMMFKKEDDIVFLDPHY
jgi:hypothetical protein